MPPTDSTNPADRVGVECADGHLPSLLDAFGGHGVPGELKNLIFAADVPRPEIAFSDALDDGTLDNGTLVVENEQFRLVLVGTAPGFSPGVHTTSANSSGPVAFTSGAATDPVPGTKTVAATGSPGHAAGFPAIG